MECATGVINPCPTNLQGPAANLFLALINTLMASQCALGPQGKYPEDYGPNLHDGEEFDFIVVGAGSAGAVVASRLSEIEKWKVLVLEAGTYPSAMSEIPALMPHLLGTSEDWQYRMEPSDKYCLGLKGKVCTCPRGKALGGSSTINAMMYIRGNRKDYDSWAEAGNPGWDYDSVMNYFKRFEGTEQNSNDERGKGGDLKLTRYTCVQPIRQALEDAYKSLGYREYQEEKMLGYADIYNSISQGTRSNTGKAFLGKAKDRKNLHLVVKAHVAKLLINEQTKTVEGLEVRVNNKLYKVKSRKEVILSAGALNSPQILMNSGIGPKEHLESLGIQVAEDLRVGENLHDHSIYPAFFVNLDKSAVNFEAPTAVIDYLYDYFMYRKGPLTTDDVTNFAAFVNPRNDSQYPSIQYVHLLYHPNDQLFLPVANRYWNLPDEITDVQSEYNKDASSILFIPVLLNPKSRGKLLLRNTDPFAMPRIIPNYFDDDDDLKLLIEGIRMLEKLIKTEAFAKYNAELIDTDIENCRNLERGTDEFWECAVRNFGTHLFHPVGTCKMGPKEDPTAVVSPRLKVHGIEGLRVIDASIMPTVTSCNTNAPSIMIGEKGAALIREDWLGKHDEL